jgi:hypothetical protein
MGRARGNTQQIVTGLDPFVKAFGSGRGLNTKQSAERDLRAREDAIPRPFSETAEDGSVSICYYLHNRRKAGVLHRENGPAVVGNTHGDATESYYINGELHREDAPARITTAPDGTRSEEWYRHDERDREDGPAVISRNGERLFFEHWFRDGLLHRDDGPAMTNFEDDGEIVEHYFRENELHREDGPARIRTHVDGTVSVEFWREGDLINQFSSIAVADIPAAATVWRLNSKVDASE